MSVRSVLKAISPPIAVTAAKKLFPAQPNGPPDYEAVPYDPALWASDRGWQHQSIAEAQLKKWPAFLASVEGTSALGWAHEATLSTLDERRLSLGAHNTILTFGYVLGRAALGQQKLSILDWGGGCGHYYIYARRLLPELRLDYTVKDFPALCAVGRKLLPEVTFISDHDTGRHDLVMASGSLQYSERVYSDLATLCDAAGRWLMLTRIPCVETVEDFVFIQRGHRHGYQTVIPSWILNRRGLLNVVQDSGFRLDRELLLGDMVEPDNAPERATMRGFLFHRLLPDTQ